MCNYKWKVRTLKTGVLQIRTEERDRAMLDALAQKNVGETNTERVKMGLELLCQKHRIRVPA